MEVWGSRSEMGVQRKFRVSQGVHTEVAKDEDKEGIISACLFFHSSPSQEGPTGIWRERVPGAWDGCLTRRFGEHDQERDFRWFSINGILS